MGASGRWIRLLIGPKPPADSASGGGGGGKGRKWSRLWRSSSASRCGSGNASATEAASEAHAFSSAVAAVARAPACDFRLVKQEWAAVRIQTTFRAFLARRALRALRGIVRLQALVRGRRVRKQMAVTLKCMHALVRAQERARERRKRLSADGRYSQNTLDEHGGRPDPIKEAEERWCDSQGSLDEVRSKIHMRQEGAIKRERAISYALSHQQQSSNHIGRSPGSPSVSFKNREANRSNRSWSYLEGWMAMKPWESRLSHTECSTNSRCSESCQEPNVSSSKLSDASSVKIRRNSVTTRVAAKPPSMPSASSSDFVSDENSPSTSSVTPVPDTNFFASERRSNGGHGGGPNYMNLTKSAKARLNGCSTRRAPLQRQGSGNFDYCNRVALSSIDARSNAGSELSVTSKRLNSISLKGRSMRRSLDKENDGRHTCFRD